MLRFLKSWLSRRVCGGASSPGALDEQGWGPGKEEFVQLVAGVRDYAVFLLDRNGIVRTWNAGAERVKGYQAEEIIGQHFSRFYPPESVASGWPAHELRVAARTGRFEDEGWRLRKDGSMFWANVVITALKDESGGVRGYLKITRDLTERRQAEESARRLLQEEAARKAAEEAALEIERQRRQLHVTLSSIGDAVIVTDQKGDVTFLNPVAVGLTGWQPHEAVGQPLERICPIINEQTRESVENPIRRVFRERTVVGLANHTALVARDGREVPVQDSAAPIRGNNEDVGGAVLVFRDVTEARNALEARQRTEEALRRSEARFRELADAMPQIVWAARPDGYVDYYNQRWHRYTGSEVIEGNEVWTEIVHPEDLPGATQRWDESLRTGTPFEMETRLREGNRGEYRWHLIRTLPVRNESGIIVRWYGTATDIDEQKRAGDAARFLAEASAALANLVDYQSTLQRVANLAVPYFADWSAVDVAGEGGSLRRLAVAHQDPHKIRLAQELFQRYPPSLSAADGIGQVFRSARPQIMAEITDEMLVQGARDEEHLQLIRSLGLRSYICVPLVVAGKPLGVVTFATAESGRHYGAADLALAQDLAHRAAVAIENANLYRALREEDRRKSEFLATLAHELRNPLAPLRNGLEVMKLAHGDAAAVEQSRTMMERQLQHLVRLVDDLLDVSRISRGNLQLRKERITLAAVVSHALEVYEALARHNEHELTVTLPAEPVYVDADRTRLAQVLSNLLTNAVKYSERGSRIWLSVERAGDQALLRVKDEGVGIPPEMLPRVFELFWQVDRSLEKSQGGLGVGLTIVKRLVEMHGGSIEAHSEGLGTGSEFIIRLPVARPLGPTATASTGEHPASAPFRRRILLADDNVDAVESLAVMLKMMGNDVRTVHDGLSAVEVAAEFRPELILLDIGMPKLNGYDACRRIRQQPWSGDVVMVALTGWGQEEDRRRSQAAGFTRHLVKPVEPAALEKLLAVAQPGEPGA